MSGAKTHFFSHDFNSRNNYKMLELREEFGFEGYGIFWAICETIAENDKPIELSKLGIIAMSLSIDKVLLAKVVDLCLRVNLFQDIDGFLTSEALESRLDMKRKATERAKKGAEARWKNATAKDKQSDSNAQAMLKQCTSNANNTTQHNTKQHKTKDINKSKAKPSLTPISERKSEFIAEVNSFSLEYGEDMLEAFLDYYTETTTSKPVKMKKETYKTWDTNLRLKKWARNNFGSKSKGVALVSQPKTFAQMENEQAWENMQKAQETLENW